MMSYYVATLLDLERFESAPEKHKENGQLLAFFIPIVKSFLTDVSQEVSSLGVQIYGGHGFIREWGMEQLMRDSRILMIYEGTNGIQALDFIGRKNLHNKGRTLNKLVEKIRSFCRTQESKLNHLIMPLQEILSEWQSIFKHAQTKAHENPEEIGAMSVDFLQYSAYVCLGYFWLQMAAKAQEQIDAGSSDVDFYLSKITTAEFYFSRILPRTQTHKAGLLSGADNLMKLDSEHFSF